MFIQLHGRPMEARLPLHLRTKLRAFGMLGRVFPAGFKSFSGSPDSSSYTARLKVAHQLGHVLQQLLPRLFRLLVSFGGPVAPRWLQEQTASRANVATSNIDVSFPNVEVAPAPPRLVHLSCSHRFCRGCSPAIRQESLQSI